MISQVFHFLQNQVISSREEMLQCKSRCTVFLQRGSCIYDEKSYGMSLGSYYKILVILRWPELEFSKLNVFRAFQDPVTFGGFVLYFASLLNKMQHI